METARRMVMPVMEGYGLCIAQNEDVPDQVCHSGANQCFIAYWTLSLKQDLCVAGMFNGSARACYVAWDKMCGFIDSLAKKEE